MGVLTDHFERQTGWDGSELWAEGIKDEEVVCGVCEAQRRSIIQVSCVLRACSWCGFFVQPPAFVFRCTINLVGFRVAALAVHVPPKDEDC